jgi:hypothetical protein
MRLARVTTSDLIIFRAHSARVVSTDDPVSLFHRYECTDPVLHIPPPSSSTSPIVPRHYEFIPQLSHSNRKLLRGYIDVYYPEEVGKLGEQAGWSSFPIYSKARSLAKEIGHNSRRDIYFQRKPHTPPLDGLHS